MLLCFSISCHCKLPLFPNFPQELFLKQFQTSVSNVFQMIFTESLTTYGQQADFQNDCVKLG